MGRVILLSVSSDKCRLWWPSVFSVFSRPVNVGQHQIADIYRNNIHVIQFEHSHRFTPHRRTLAPNRMCTKAHARGYCVHANAISISFTSSHAMRRCRRRRRQSVQTGTSCATLRTSRTRAHEHAFTTRSILRVFGVALMWSRRALCVSCLSMRVVYATKYVALSTKGGA